MGVRRPAARSALARACGQRRGPGGTSLAGRFGEKLLRYHRDGSYSAAQIADARRLALDGVPYRPVLAVAFSAAVIARIASAFAEAGANVIFIREDALPSTEVFSDWNSSLSSTVNIIRFYEALPILLVTDPGAANANRSEMFSQIRDCITCPANDGGQPARLSAGAEKENPARGVALALELFNSQEFPAEASDGALRCMISNGNPAVITTAGDVAATVDVKRLNKIWELLHCS